jgi:hypothetical protein
VAELAAQTFTVDAAAATAQPHAAPPLRPAIGNDVAAPAPIAIAAPGEDSRFWRPLALAAIGLWLLSVIAGAFWLLRRRTAARRSATAAPATAARSGSYEFRSACTRGDLNAAARALLRWGRRERPALRNLGELAAAVHDDAQRTVVRELERVLYGGAPGAGIGERLLAAFGSGPAFTDPARANAAPALAPLYPFDIRKQA